MQLSTDEIIDLLENDGGKFQTKSLSEAYNFCKKITLGHYENFPVASLAIAKPYRNHFYAIYSFCRIADDLGDRLSVENKELATHLLDFLAYSAREAFTNSKYSPLFLALKRTVQDLQLPAEPFIKLTIAFKNDIYFKQPETLDDLLNYCKYSANPVGELVLRLFNEFDEEKAELSDKICTALQLVNFFQDISVDKKIGRIYIPKDYIPEINLQNLLNNEKKSILYKSLKELYLLTSNLFNEGKNLLKIINSKRLKFEISIIINGGEIILDKVVRLKENIIETRPELTKIDKLKMIIKSFF